MEDETANIEPCDDAVVTATTSEDTVNLGKTWRNLARAMLKHRMMSMLGMTPTYVPNEAQEQYRFTS